MMYQTGFPDPVPPTRAAPWTGDYLTALFAMWSSLAGVAYARATGKGQAIDVAQYEAIHKTMGGTMLEYFEAGGGGGRSGGGGEGGWAAGRFQGGAGWVVRGGPG